jgi:hypothetical protein
VARWVLEEERKEDSRKRESFKYFAAGQLLVIVKNRLSAAPEACLRERRRCSGVVHSVGDGRRSMPWRGAQSSC